MSKLAKLVIEPFECFIEIGKEIHLSDGIRYNVAGITYLAKENKYYVTLREVIIKKIEEKEEIQDSKRVLNLKDLLSKKKNVNPPIITDPDLDPPAPIQPLERTLVVSADDVYTVVYITPVEEASNEDIIKEEKSTVVEPEIISIYTYIINDWISKDTDIMVYGEYYSIKNISRMANGKIRVRTIRKTYMEGTDNDEPEMRKFNEFYDFFINEKDVYTFVHDGPFVK